MADWKERIRIEFERAESARASGNEGQARVCARRAAGIAIREFYARRGQTIRTPSAYDLLQMLAEDPKLSPDTKQAAVLLTVRVNQEFNLPVDVDLLVEARKLCEALLKE